MTEHNLRGFVFHSHDNLSLAQFRVDGFTFNRLRPYTSWEQIWKQAEALWLKYKEVAEPLAVTRLALRYINHIDLGSDAAHWNDVLACPIPVPSSMAVGIDRFTSRVTVRHGEKELFAHVTQAVDPKPDGREVRLILDIDAFRPLDLPVSHDNLDEVLGAAFAELRDFKNTIFFASMKEDVYERFE